MSTLWAGCAPAADQPTSQLIDVAVDSTIDVDSLSVGLATRPPVSVVLDSPIYQFGGSPKTEAEELGVVDFGIVLSNGAAVLSDASNHRLVYLSPSGQVRALFGRRGEGPAEIGQASGLYLRDDGKLVFRDAEHQRAGLFSPNDTALQFEGTFRIDSYARQFCSLNGNTVGVRYRPQRQRTLEVMSDDGTEVKYIGLPLVRGVNQVNVIWTNGALMCLPQQQRVIFAAQTGDVLAYHADGRLVWRRKIADFHPSQVKIVGGGVLLTAAPPPLNRSATVRSLVRLDSTTGLLQMILLKRNGEGKSSTVERVGIDSRIIDLENGAELGRQSNLPLFISARDGLALSTVEDPEPVVSLIRFRLIRQALPVVPEIDDRSKRE